MPTKTVGILHSGEQAKQRQSVAWFKNELARWVQGTSITINYDPADALWSDDRRALLDQNARTLATNANLNLIIAAGGSRSVFALQQAQRAAGTNTPVVFTTFYNTTSPPTTTNMCGVCPHTSDKDVDRLTNFRTRFPVSSYGVLQNRSRFDYDPTNAKFVAWANANVPLNYQTVSDMDLGATIITEINTAFDTWRQSGITAALVCADPIFNEYSQEIKNAAKPVHGNKIKTMHQWHDFVNRGHGDFAYGCSLRDAYELAAKAAKDILVNNKTPQQVGVLQIPLTAHPPMNIFKRMWLAIFPTRSD
jgi:hypothetical protein